MQSFGTEYLFKEWFKRPTVYCVVAFFTCLLVFGYSTPSYFGFKINIWKILVSSICIIIYITMSMFLYSKTLASIEICTDNDGLWYKYIGKEIGLISWKQIAFSKQSVCSNSIYLSDTSNKALINIDLGLKNIHQLRLIIAEKITNNHNIELSNTPDKNETYVLGFFTLFLLLIFSLLSKYTLFYKFFFAMTFSFCLTSFITYIFISTIYKINLKNNLIELQFPFKKVEIPLSNIKKISLTNSKNPTIKILTANKKTYKIKYKSISNTTEQIDIYIIYKILLKK